MDPLINAVLGVLFIGVGAAATLLMCHLRGSVVRPKTSKTEPTKTEAGGTKDAKRYLAPWSRPSDGLEIYMADIHAMAETGRSRIEAMRTRKKTFSWDDLLVKGAQLAKSPLNDDEPARTETVIGSAAQQPLVVDTPIYVTHMSFGALSREVKIALARGTAAVGAAMCSGEGGILEDELQAAHKYIFEYVPNGYSVTDENLRRVDAIEIKFGQSAKPGMGGIFQGIRSRRRSRLCGGARKESTSSAPPDLTKFEQGTT